MCVCIDVYKHITFIPSLYMLRCIISLLISLFTLYNIFLYIQELSPHIPQYQSSIWLDDF